MIYTAVMGHGTVGSGVVEILLNNNSLISEKIKDKIDVKYIAKCIFMLYSYIIEKGVW